MQIKQFKEIVSTFADPGSPMLFEKSRFVISVNGDLIDASITMNSGDIYVDEGVGRQPASKWIVNRLARLPLLATRLEESIPKVEHFVSPSALLLDTLEAGSKGAPTRTTDALAATLETIDARSPLETMVLYITSDAGEGKTSLINELARLQASLFAKNERDWLLVPITLGGRHFLRFDDITVGALQNRYRFPFLYYNSFLALVKMGVIVPAFDGFEEMFVETSSGEALSAMGILVSSLDSQGAILVAARKAYFEFENLSSQQRLFDTIRTYAVGFGKLELERWTRSQFIDYCTKRALSTAEQLYDSACERLSANHALLTRAVLVRRLVDVAEASPSLDAFLLQLQTSGADYFSVFVRGLIEREANEKWIDRTGERDMGSPLLSVEEHCDLLSQIALAMWEAKLDFLKRDNLDFVADYFSDLARKNPFQAQQIKERIRGHAMLVPSNNSPQAVEFDHDEFRFFFLGEGIAQQARCLDGGAKTDVLGTLRRGVLPRQAQDALIRSLCRNKSLDRLQLVRFFVNVAQMDAQASYTHENCGEIVIRLLSEISADGMEIPYFSFPNDALRDKKLSDVRFRDCYFSPTSLELSSLSNTRFEKCKFAQLRRLDSGSASNVIFTDCAVDSIVLSEDRETWDPIEISDLLHQFGIKMPPVQAPLATLVRQDPDPALRDIERLIRYFMRSTHISESVMQIKLGTRAGAFIGDTLPELLRRGILEEINNRGGGEQRRFRLGIPLMRLESALAGSHGSLEQFLQNFQVPR